MAEQMDREELTEKLRDHDQQHLIEWLGELEEEERERLEAQLAGIDFGRLEDFQHLLDTPPTAVSFGDVEPARIERLPLTPEDQEQEEKVEEIGRDVLRADRVAALTVAGGQGTRLRYEHAKGMYPISPIKEKSLFQMFAEQILAARRRYGCSMPWLIMTGPTNDQETREFFADNDFFGLGGDSVHFFIQGANPIIDPDGRLLLAERDRLLMGPDGHGGTLDALARHGLLQMLREGGWDLVSYFQVDNPLVTVADPRYLGHHVRRDADFSCKVVPKRDPEEGLGIAVRKGGQPAIIEYIDVPEEIAAQRRPSGELRYRYGSIAIHIFGVPFAERVAGTEQGLPWHVAKKQYEIYEPGDGKELSPPEHCHKFERFIFDSLKFADECAFVEVRRNAEFAPVKNAEGEDSPATARRLLQRYWMEWVMKASALEETPQEFSEPIIEISPLFAADAAELEEKAPSDWKPTFPLVLDEDSEI
jgi:UDP-N-acetylglucosamine/UDP-N-acetylgalactosamine diphosphorylase